MSINLPDGDTSERKRYIIDQSGKVVFRGRLEDKRSYVESLAIKILIDAEKIEGQFVPDKYDDPRWRLNVTLIVDFEKGRQSKTAELGVILNDVDSASFGSWSWVYERPDSINFASQIEPGELERWGERPLLEIESFAVSYLAFGSKFLDRLSDP